MADSLPPPILDTSQYPAYFDAQRKQQMAQMLMQSFMQQQNAPPPVAAPVGPYQVTPRKSILSSVTPLVTALLAGKASNDAMTAQKQYLIGPHTQAQTPTGPGDGIISPDAPPEAQAAAQAVTESGLVKPPAAAPTPPRDPRIPPGMTPGAAQAMLNLFGPEEYAKTFLAPNFTPTDLERQLRAAGIEPQSPTGLAIQKQVLQKSAYIAPIEQRAGSIERDPLTNHVIGQNPALPTGAVNLYDDNGRYTGSAMGPGAAQAISQSEAAKTAGVESQTPHYEPDPFHPGQSRIVFPKPPALSGNGVPASDSVSPAKTSTNAPANSPTVRTPSTAADLKGQEAGATAGIAYAQKLNEQAQSALQGKRVLSEMGNLLQGFTPGAGAPVLASLGGVAQAFGVPSEKVEKFTKMNVGDTEAFQKGTAALAAESAEQMTNKVTQQDFQTYLKNNPNWMMTPDGIKRAMDYISRGFDQPLAKQAAFAAYSKTASPDRWSIDFDAKWNQSEENRIKQGAYNSAPASLTGIRTSSDLAKSPATTYSEGQIAHNPKTGQVLIYQQGRWIPKQ